MTIINTTLNLRTSTVHRLPKPVSGQQDRPLPSCEQAGQARQFEWKEYIGLQAPVDISLVPNKIKANYPGDVSHDFWCTISCVSAAPVSARWRQTEKAALVIIWNWILDQKNPATSAGAGRSSNRRMDILYFTSTHAQARRLLACSSNIMRCADTDCCTS